MIHVENGGAYTERVCQIAASAIAELSTCSLPVTRPISISLSRELEELCVGLYHCGGDRIEVLHPDTLAEKVAESAVFSGLATMEYFDSIIFHEMVHAAFDEVPCPFERCTATSEYLAYALQIRNLDDDERRRIGLGEVPEEKVSSQKFSAIMVFWAPDRFAVNAWAHLMQRPDPCGYVARIAAGDVRFDTETPFILSPPE